MKDQQEFIVGGLAPTISARDYKGAIKILVNGSKADDGRKCQ